MTIDMKIRDSFDDAHPSYLNQKGTVLVLPRNTGDDYGDKVEKLLEAAKYNSLDITESETYKGFVLQDMRDYTDDTRHLLRDMYLGGRNLILTELSAIIKAQGYDVDMVKETVRNKDGNALYMVVATKNGHTIKGDYTRDEIIGGGLPR